MIANEMCAVNNDEIFKFSIHRERVNQFVVVLVTVELHISRQIKRESVCVCLCKNQEEI